MMSSMCTTRPPRRRDGPDSMDKLFKQDFVIHTLDNYPQFLNSSVPYFVDSRLNNEGRRKVAMILDKLPYRDRLLPLLDGMRPEALMRESQTEYGQSLTHANSEGLRLSIDLEFEADPVRSDEFLRRRPKKGKQFSPGVSVVRTDWPLIFKVAPELEGSREEGLLLRNFVWRSTVADMYGVWDNFYPTALSFEPAPPMITEDLPFSAFTPEPSEVQLRIFWNPYAPHALPATLNGLSQSLAENLLGPEAKITVRSNPIYREIPVYVTSLTWVLYSLLSLGMASLPQRFGNQVMFDQYMKTKHSLIVMGCPFPVYWIGTFVMNWLILLLANTLVTGALAWFVPIFTDHSSSLIAVQLSMTSYSAAVLVYAYFWTFIFDSSRSYSLFMNLSTMMLSLGPAYLVSTFHDYKEQSIGGIPLPYISPIIHKVACFTLAPYVPVGTLMSVVMVINQANAERRTARLEEFFSFSNNVVWAMAGGLVQTVLYGLLIMFLDSRQYTAKVPNRATVQALKAWKEVRQNVRAQVLQQGGAEGLVPPQFQINKDSDVIHEEKRVDDIMTVFLAQDEARKTGQDVPRHFPNLNGDAPQVLPLIIVHRLHHLYLPTSSAGEPTVAVKGLSLGVSPGEVMGLLGPNGAGKSTTINLITSDSHLDAPSEGDGYLGGISVTQDPQTAFPYIGLVPQFDALWPEVTVDDNLYVFSKIKALDRHKRITELSGGNKRRASVAVAFLGDPKVVLMDEPSSGIDPGGRRKLLEMIQKEGRNRAIIITTHSMEEAESLCTKCLNTCLAIKNNYGSGIRFEVELESDWKGTGRLNKAERDRVVEWVKTKLSPNATLMDEVASRLFFNLPLGTKELGKIFRTTSSEAKNVGIRDYAVSQPTLDQVFTVFARRQMGVAPPQAPGA